MKIRKLSALCVFLGSMLSTSYHSQITINNTLYTPTQLVDGVLVPAGAVTSISNVVFQGVYNSSSRYQVGYFSTAGNTLTQMGFTNGIVISTGNTSDIPYTLGADPGAAAQMSTGYTSGTPGELRQTGSPTPPLIQDLDVLAGSSNYFNGAILEFDFVPISTSVQFRYIFGSEEYRDNNGFINYNCSSYNDKFGFLISGPGIAGGQGYSNNARNIARLANGSEVAINSVNSGQVGSSGGAPSASNCLAANPDWVQNVSTAEFLGTIDGTELNGNTIILTASQTGLTPGATYHIKLIVTDAADAAYDSVVYLEAGSFTTDDTPCTPPNAPTIGLITQPTCTDPNGSVVLSGLPNGSWTIDPGNVLGVGNSTTINNLTPGVTYNFTVTDDLGCTSDPSLDVVINPAPTAPTAPVIASITQPTCTSPTGAINLTGLPASGNWTLTTNPGNVTTNGSGTTNSLSGLAPNTTYTFTVSDANGCTSPVSLNGVINAVPTASPADAGTYAAVCIDHGLIALAGSPAGGVFSGTGVNGTDFDPSNGTQTITYTYVDANGCTSNDQTQITVNPLPTVNAGQDQTLCEGDAFIFNATGAANYVWDNGGVQGTTITPAVGTVTYTVTGTDANGCVNTDQITVQVDQNPTAVISSDVFSGQAPLTVNFYNTSLNATNYNWNFGNGAGLNVTNTNDQVNVFTTEGIYTVVLTAINGVCQDQASVQIIVLPPPAPVIDVPNVFTPNDDHTNDEFTIKVQNVLSIDVVIINRWGNVMYEYHDLNGFWDGTSNGKKADEGVYFYKYTARALNGEVLTGHGPITLAR